MKTKAISLSALVVTIVLSTAGCPPTGVGDPCTPETEPEGGFTEDETLIETNSIQCRTRTCMVYNMESFCTRKCKEESDCLAEWYESGPGQSDEEPAFCEALVEVGPSNVVGRYCVPSYASKDY